MIAWLAGIGVPVMTSKELLQFTFTPARESILVIAVEYLGLCKGIK